MLNFITNFFRPTAAANPARPLFDQLESRCLLSASMMDSGEPMFASDSGGMHDTMHKTKKASVVGTYTGVVHVNELQQDIPVTLTITRQKGDNLKGSVQATGVLPASKFTAAVTAKGVVNANFSLLGATATLKGKFSKAGVYSGTLKATLNGLKLTGTFSFAKSA